MSEAHPFRFFQRDYDLQGQESESFVLRFADRQLEAPLSDDLVDALAAYMAEARALSLLHDHGPAQGVAHLALFYERDEDEGIDHGAFDADVDAIAKIIHAHHPLAEVVHVGGNDSRDAWEQWSRAQGEPRAVALEIVVNAAGFVRRVHAPADGDDHGEPIRVERGTLCARVHRKLADARERAAAAELAAARAEERPRGLGLHPAGEALAGGARWLSEPSPIVADALAEASGEPSFWFDRWAVATPDGGAVALLLFVERRFSKRELTWVGPDGELERSGVSIASIHLLPDGSVVYPFGKQLRRFARGMAEPEVLGEWGQPLRSLAGLGDALVAATRDRRRRDVVALVRAREGAVTTVDTVALAPEHLRAVPGLEFVLAWSRTKLWCVTAEGDRLRVSEPVAGEVSDVGLAGETVVIRRADGVVFELCNVRTWLAGESD